MTNPQHHEKRGEEPQKPEPQRTEQPTCKFCGSHKIRPSGVCETCDAINTIRVPLGDGASATVSPNASSEALSILQKMATLAKAGTTTSPAPSSPSLPSGGMEAVTAEDCQLYVDIDCVTRKPSTSKSAYDECSEMIAAYRAAHVERRLKEVREKMSMDDSDQTAKRLMAENADRLCTALIRETQRAERAEQQLAQTQAELAQAKKDIEWVETRISCDDSGAELLKERATAQSLAKRVEELEAERGKQRRRDSFDLRTINRIVVDQIKELQARITELNDALEKERKLGDRLAEVIAEAEQWMKIDLNIINTTPNNLTRMDGLCTTYREKFLTEALAAYTASRQPGEALKDGSAILPVPPEARRLSGTQGLGSAARTEGAL